VPVFEQTYPRWRASEASRVRWWPIVRRELQMLLAQRPFVVLLFVCALPTLIHLLQIYSVNKLAADPHGELARALRNVSIVIDPEFFFQFMQLQMYFVSVLLLYASSGLVCDDIRLNLAEVYFSKPLTVRDYLIGKVATVVGLGLVYTAVPALFLIGAEAMMAPGSGMLAHGGRLPLAALGTSLVIVLPIGLCTLACSALTPSRGFAAAAVIALLAADTFTATLLAEILDRREANVVNVPAAVLRIGEALFGVRPYMPLAWGWALLVVAAVSALALAVLYRRIRAVDLGT
jgi:ABC-type transport system involved in multi-copper enzyme maturation permease subunit